MLAAAAAGSLLLPVATRVAGWVGAIARPREDRLSGRSVPTLGGVAIVGGILVGTLVGVPRGDLLPLVAGIAAMALLGFLDDIGSVGPFVRLAVQGSAAVAFTYAVSSSLDGPARLAACLAAVIAVPLAMNATNLVDNADGLAASLSAVTALGLAGLAAAAGTGSGVPVLGLVIAAACLVFLALANRPPAAMFMGDVGSLGLGFALAATTILLVRDAISGPSSGLIAAVLFAVVWAVQLGDLALVFVSRLRRGVSPLRGGVDHTSHRLLLLGLSPTAMLALLVTLAAALAAAGVLVATTQQLPLALAAVVVAAAVMVTFEWWLARVTAAYIPSAVPVLRDDRRSVSPSVTRPPLWKPTRSPLPGRDEEGR